MARELTDKMGASLAGMSTLLFAVGQRRMPAGVTGAFVKLLGLGTALWVLYTATIAVIDPLALAAIFLSLMLGLLFLVVAPKPTSEGQQPSLPDYLLCAGALACGAYFALEADRIVARISLLDPLTGPDLFFGSLLCLLAVEATRRTVGLGLTIIVIAILGYNLWGHLLPGLMGHGHITFEHFLDQTVFTTNGIFGAPVRVAATYAFLFVTFGTILEKAGGSEFFFNLAASISGRSVGGPAKVSVVSSALYGTVSGSPTSDVVTTGSITIPMMRRLGYPRSLAGAIEVAASTSGGLIPPVMASAAFIMVEITGIAYVTIAKAALIPAFLYLLGLFVQVHLLSQKLGLAPMDARTIPGLRQTLRAGGLFMLPLFALTFALFMGYTANLVALVGIATILAVAMLKPATRLGPRALLNALVTVSLRMVAVTAACAAAGLVVGGISMTGLSGKLSYLVFQLSGDAVFISVLLTAVLAILLGMGMPTPSAYIMAAVLTAPILLDLGLSTLTAHMFLLYFAVLSAMTPPVAVAAFAASSLAEDNPLAIAGKAVMLALPAFVIPFIFAFRPALLGQGSGMEIVHALITASIGVIFMAVAVAGYLRCRLNWYRRLLFLAAGVLLTIPGWATDVAGLLAGGLALSGAVWSQRSRLATPVKGQAKS